MFRRGSKGTLKDLEDGDRTHIFPEALKRFPHKPKATQRQVVEVI